MYKIIGADGRVYGPVDEAKMRQWIAENRANAQTLVQKDESPEWHPLSQFPEFADLVARPPEPPVVAVPDQQKSKLVAGLLGVLVGWAGVHRFYLGYTGIGVAQILVTIFTCGAGWIWGFIEGILILVGSGITTDADGRPLKD